MSEQAELRNSLDGEGRLTLWPSKCALQQVALGYLASKFEAGRV